MTCLVMQVVGTRFLTLRPTLCTIEQLLPHPTLSLVATKQCEGSYAAAEKRMVR